MFKAAFSAMVGLCLLASGAHAGVYYQQKWFDYPDPATAPRFANGCAHYATFPSFKCSGAHCGHTTAKVCTNPTHVQVALLRKDVVFVVHGPDTADQAVKNAVEGLAAGCATSAITHAVAVGAGDPEPTSKIPAAVTVLVADFHACIISISAAGAVGAIVKELEIGIDTSQSHWSPV